MQEIEVSGRDLASAFGVSERSVRDFADRGIVLKTGRGKYKLVESVRLYTEHLRATASGRGGEDEAKSLTSERTRLAREQADQAALKNALARRELVSIDEVSRGWTDILRKVRSRILACPSRIRSRLSHLGASIDRLNRRATRMNSSIVGGGEAIGMFRHDLLKYEAEVAKAVKVPLKQHEFDAIVSWHYNTGAVATASWIKKLNAGDRAGALKGIMDWRKPAEIIPRRTAERDLFKTGKYPAPFATIYPAVNGKVQWKQGKRVDLAKALAASPAPEPIKPSTGPISGPPPLGTPIPGTTPPAKPVAPPVAAPVVKQSLLAWLLSFLPSRKGA